MEPMETLMAASMAVPRPPQSGWPLWMALLGMAA
jgi:hypothetical protein